MCAHRGERRNERGRGSSTLSFPLSARLPPPVSDKGKKRIAKKNQKVPFSCYVAISLLAGSWVGFCRVTQRASRTISPMFVLFCRFRFQNYFPPLPPKGTDRHRRRTARLFTIGGALSGRAIFQNLRYFSFRLKKNRKKPSIDFGISLLYFLLSSPLCRCCTISKRTHPTNPTNALSFRQPTKGMQTGRQ